MRSFDILWAAGAWLRQYAVALALVMTLAGSLVAVNIWGSGPVAQQPPEGYTIERDRASLQWDKGTREAPVTLQVSVGSPDFDEMLVNKVVKGNGHTLRKLERGATYYWRLVQNGKAGPTASFKVSRYNVDL